MEVSVVYHGLAALPPVNLFIHLGRGGGARVDTRVNLDSLEKWKILCLCRESRPDRPSRSLVTTLTELSQLLLV